MGWDSLGCLAGEVKNPARSYPRGIFIVAVINTIVYVCQLTVVNAIMLVLFWDLVSLL